jgi:aminoglycoside phosphotransferase (APT) family kinase protein
VSSTVEERTSGGDGGGALDEAAIAAWIESEVGGRVTAMERQGRWRPAWYVDLDGGSVAGLYVRGARLHDHLPYSLERELEIHRLLEQGGLRVPHLYGYVPGVRAIVMERVPGRADLRFAESPADRDAVRRQLVQQMVAMHSLDPAPFHAAGLRLPDSPEATALSFFDDAVAHYRARKRLPNPRLELLIGWVERNVRPAATPPRVTACDAGQFLYEGGTLTALVDFELTVLGDPAQDLATLRRRSTYEPMGDVAGLLELYEQESGSPIDLDAVRFQTVVASAAAAVCGMLWMEDFLEAPGDDGDYVQFASWVANSTKQGYEALAELTGWPLPDVALGAPLATPAHDALAAIRATIDGLDGTEDYRSYQRRTLLDTVAYLERLGSHGDAHVEAYLDGAAAVLGTRPRDVAEADRALDAHVRAVGGEDEQRLFELLAADSLWRALLLAIPGSQFDAGLTGRLAPLT